MFPFVVLIGVVVIIGAVFWFGHLMEKQRREQLLQEAESMGLAYAPDGDEAFHRQLAPFAVFNKGRKRKLTNLIQGESDEVRISIFDYSYTTGSGKNQSTTRQTITSLDSSQLSIPEFTMRPEGMLDKIGGVLGLQDIDFDSHPEFSKMFVLKGPNEERIRVVFGPKILTYFEQNKGLSIEAFPGSLIFYRARQKLKPSDVKNSLELAYQIFGLFADAKVDSAKA